MIHMKKNLSYGVFCPKWLSRAADCVRIELSIMGFDLYFQISFANCIDEKSTNQLQDFVTTFVINSINIF